jgi:hypothetical protein
MFHNGMIMVTLDPGVESLELAFLPVLVHNDHQQISPFLIWCTYHQMKIQGKGRALMVEMETLRMTLDLLKANNHPNTQVLKEAKKAVKRRENTLHWFAEVVINLPYRPMMLLLATLDIPSQMKIPMNVDQVFFNLFLLDWLWLCWCLGISVHCIGVPMKCHSLEKSYSDASTRCESENV